jgi:hypothetical protein
MKKVLLIAATAAFLAGPVCAGAALAQNRDRADRGSLTAN